MEQSVLCEIGPRTAGREEESNYSAMQWLSRLITPAHNGTHWDQVDCEDRIDIPSYHLSLYNFPRILSPGKSHL